MSKATKKLREDNRIDNWSYLWMAMFTAVGFLIFNIINSFFGTTVLKFFGATIIVLLIGGLLYSAWKKTNSERRTVYIILFISIVLRICYVIYTSGGEFSGEDFNIFTQVQTNLTLPEAPQPLYYIVSAAIYNFMAMFHFTAPFSMDIVRLVTEYMGIVSAIAIYYILCELEANDTAIYLGTSIIAFHPGLIRLGGEISPLMPMFAMITLAIVFLTRWNNFTNGFDFIMMSVFFGVAVMIDMSALILLPVIAVLVVINLVRVITRKNLANIVSTLLQTLAGLAVFGIMSFAYPVKNIAMGQPVGIMELFGSSQGDLNLKTKFLSFSAKELFDVFIHSNDKCAWVYLVKSSVFGKAQQLDPVLPDAALRVFIGIAFASAAISGFCVFGNMIARADSKKKVNIWTIIAMVGCTVAYYILQNRGSQSASAMDFRVIPVILALGVTMLCNGMKVLSMKKKLSFVSQILYLLTVIVCLTFCIGCVIYGCWFI
jgi:Dolichyl-phosphate-mannose-protein mannosyltransferase.